MRLSTAKFGRAEELGEDFARSLRTSSTRSIYRGAVFTFLAWCRDNRWRDLAELSHDEYDLYLAELHEGRKPRTMTVHHAALRAYCACLISLDLLSINPMDRVPRPLIVAPPPTTALP